MIRNVLQSIGGIEIYPIISLFIFLSVFAVVLVWFFLANKNHLHTMAQLPLDDATTGTVQG
jgi:hypothetical protein